MKKTLLSLLAVCGMLTAGAQYFQHTYGTPTWESPRSGKNLFVNPPGHILAGATDNTGGTPFDMMLTRTDINGNIPGAPEFNNAYQIWDPISGNQLSTEATKVIELANGNFFVVGNFRNGSPNQPNGIYSAVFNNLGVMLAIRQYNLPGANFIELNSVCPSNVNPNEVYACGSADIGTTGTIGFIVMKMNANTCNLIWGNVYQIGLNFGPRNSFATDLIESPYLPYGVNELVVIGRTQGINPMTLFDGFACEIDINTGGPIAGTELYGSPNDDMLQAIAASTNNAGGVAGFVMTGHSNMATGGLNYDIWSLSVNPTLNAINWMSTNDYSTAGNNDYSFDIIERINLAGVYEYYTIGTTDVGNVGGDFDMVTTKLNAVGLGIGESTYGGTRPDIGNEIDQYAVGGPSPAPGLSNFGASQTFIFGGNDAYFVHSYFNGVSGCNENFALPIPAPQMRPITFLRHRRVQPLVQDTLKNALTFALLDGTLCYNVVIGGGNNARQSASAATPATNSLGNAYPNPIDASSPMLSVDYNSAADGTVQVRLFDVTGRICFDKQVNVITGQQTLSLDLGSGLASGIYQLQVVNSAGSIETIRVSVK